MRLISLAVLVAFILVSTAFAAEIHDAARAGDLATVKALVEKDPTLVKAVNASGATPLHLAAAMDRKEVVGYLLEKGAPVNARDSRDRTPLWAWAASGQALAVADLLLDKGADINALAGGMGTPLTMLVSRQADAEVNHLLDRGAALPPAATPEFRRLLANAVRNGLARLTNRMIGMGADLRARDEAGTSLLHMAAAGGSVPVLEALLKSGLSTTEVNGIGWTPLHYAAEAGQLKAVEYLLTRGAPLDARTRDGKSALNLASEWGRKEVADLLVANGADRGEPKFPVLTGPYLGQKPPGKTPETFAPGIVSAKHGFHGTVSFAPDGQTAWWSLLNYGGKFVSQETGIRDGRWTLPRPAPFVAQNRYDDVPFPSPDGRKLFFVSTRPLEKGGPQGKENIWVIEKTGAGWSEPQPLPPIINSLTLHWQVAVDRQGNLYFGGSTGSGQDAQDGILYAKYENGTYATPQRLGPAINGAGRNHSPFIAPDGSYLIYTRFLPQEGTMALLISFRKPDGTWTEAKGLDATLGLRGGSSCPWVSPDGKYLFFISSVANEPRPLWVDASFIEEMRKAELPPSIHDAARTGDLARVRASIEKDPALVKAVDAAGATPLHLAAGADRKDVVAYLLEKGAPVDARDAQDLTPLWLCASRATAIEVAGLLLDKGADVNATPRAGQSPLVRAAFHNSKGMVDLLLDRGASIPAPTDPNIRRLVTQAARFGQVKLMNRLVANGVALPAKDEAGTTLIHWAAAGGSVEILEMALKAGLPSGDANNAGWTPLHFAVEGGHLKMVERLLARGVRVDSRTRDGKSAFNLAQEFGKKEIADFLVTKGADQSEPKFPVLSGPYFGQKPPGKTPVPFAPGIVAGQHTFHSSVTFSPDGQAAWWSLQSYGERMASLESAVVNGRWKLPQMASFMGQNRSDDVPFPSPDGRKLFFLSTRPLEKGGRQGKENIWMMEKTGAGWSEPQPLPSVINSLTVHWQISVDRQGNLYFGGQDGILYAKYENGTYASPQILGPAINGAGRNHSPFIAPDGSYLIHSRSHPQSNTDSLFISFRRPDGTWAQTRALNPILGISSRSMCPWVSPDGKYLFYIGFFAGENKPFWVDASFIEELRKQDHLRLDDVRGTKCPVATSTG